MIDTQEALELARATLIEIAVLLPHTQCARIAQAAIDATDPARVASPAASLGAAGGRARSAAKTDAARRNGAKGGRPRKSPADLVSK